MNEEIHLMKNYKLRKLWAIHHTGSTVQTCSSDATEKAFC